MPPALVLIGPAAAGKSTLGKPLARRLGVPYVDLDAVAEPYYVEVGWSIDRLVREVDAVGRYRAEVAWEPARLHAVRRAVGEHAGTVLALGAGHTSYTSPALQRELVDALAPVPLVVFCEPFPDRGESLHELRRRSRESKQTDWISDGHDFLAGWLDDPVPRALADRVLHTGARPVSELVDTLIAAV